MGMHAFAISIFFISWAMIFGICIDYWSAASIGIRIVLYSKRTLELLIWEKRPAVKAVLANQIASFSWIKNKYYYYMLHCKFLWISVKIQSFPFITDTTCHGKYPEIRCGLRLSKMRFFPIQTVLICTCITYTRGASIYASSGFGLHT